jgi:hypothetical protein
MNLDDLGDKLAALNPGDLAEVPYDVYALLFPPGEPDDNARMRHTILRKRTIARSTFGHLSEL